MGELTENLKDTPEGSELAPQAMLANLQRRMFGAKTDAPTVDRYTVEKVLGAGAYGTVYAAHDPTLERVVALKVLAAGADESALLEEARAAAKVSHPNVIEIYEVGTTDDGKVFLAMELVEGETLRQRIERERPGLKETLDIFAQVGRGLAAVHGAGLVHGDFKPENVLLGRDGRPRVADFGLARAKDPTAGARVGQRGEVTGTPRYMAPEQHLGEDLDARADQFAFCVALFEAVCGRHPFAAGSYEELRKSVVEGDGLPDTRWPASVPRWLRALLRSGLARNPALRWPSMKEIVAALERDRMRAWRWGMAAAGAVVMAVLGGIVLTRAEPVLLAVCRAPAQTVEPIWGEARKNEIRQALLATGVSYAAQTWEHLDGTFTAYMETWRDTRDRVCASFAKDEAKSGLDPRARCLAHRLADVAALSEVLVEADAEVVARAVEAATALRPADDCLQRTAADDPAPPPVTDSVRVAEIREALSRVRAHRQAGRVEPVRNEMESLATAAASLEYAPLEAEARLELGFVLDEAGEYAASAEAHKSATWIADASGHPQVAAEAAVHAIHTIGARQARPKEALAWAETARTQLDKLGPGTLLESHYHNNVSAVRVATGEYEQALVDSERAVALKTELLGPDHIDTARSLNNVGNALEELGRFAEAREKHQRVREIFAATLGSRHPLVAVALYNLGIVDLRERRFSAARASLDQARTIWRDARGSDHVHVGLSGLALAQVALGEGKHEVAGEEVREALQRFEPMGTDHPLVAEARVVQAAVELERGSPEAALPLLERALEPLEQRGEPGQIATARFVLARTLWKLDRDHERAASLVREALAAYTKLGEGWKREAADVQSWLRAHN
jgi:tetratricopeptide (TPR) repeat protein/predicted Ser/Thr protein kinase